MKLHRWSPLLATLAMGACVRPEALPLPPQPAQALAAMWDLNGRYWGEGLSPPADFLSLYAPYQVQVTYFGCGQQELVGTPAGERGCRPTTRVGFRLSDAEPSWTPFDPAKPSEECGCADLDPYVLFESAPIIREGGVFLQGATVLPSDGELPEVLVAIGGASFTRHYRVGAPRHGVDRPSIEMVSTSTVYLQSTALWAEADGSVWSAGRSGLYRSEGRNDELRLQRVDFASTRTSSMSSVDVDLEPVSFDPLRLLLVDPSGLTLLWDRSGVIELQPGRASDSMNNTSGDTADIAPLYERGEFQGWVLVGPAEPDRPPNSKPQNAGYVVYRDGALGPPLSLPRVQSVAGSPALGTYGIDSNGGLFALSSAGAAARELGVSLATPKVLRIFDGHFVLSRERAPVVHYQRQEFGCTGRGNDLGEVLHIFPLGDLLVEVSFSGQVRWSRARSVCNLSPP